MSESEFEKQDRQSETPLDADAPGSGGDTVAAEQDAAGAETPSLDEQLQSANDRVLRAQAEVENVRKRMRRELDDQRRYANLELLGDLLPVLDNLDRAVEAAEQAQQSGGLLEGVKMVSSQMLAVLQQHGCRQIEAEGVPFDPNLHEAIGKVPSVDVAEGNIIHVTRVGYQLHDRVVRPPQVLISAGPPAGTDETAADAETDTPPSTA